MNINKLINHQKWNKVINKKKKVSHLNLNRLINKLINNQFKFLLK